MVAARRGQALVHLARRWSSGRLAPLAEQRTWAEGFGAERRGLT